jgi:sarcosine oxidase
MSNTCDAIVIGLGGMGSAAAYQLARRGQRVLGLERHTPGHAQGSSHGKSRVIRQAYFEDPAYVPLLLRAYELWREIEQETGKELLLITGGLMIGPSESGVFTGSLRSAREYGLYHEVLDAADLRRRFPQFTPGDDIVALYERQAGVVRPEEGVLAHLQGAEMHGAELHFQEPAERWEASPSGDGVRVTTAQGSYEAARLVIAPGPWAYDLFRELNLPLEVERQVLYWFQPTEGIAPFAPDRFPIYIWELEDGATIYGFPAIDGPTGGAKVAFFRMPDTFQQICTPDTIERTVHADEIALMREAIATRIPTLNGQFLEAATCMYTNTPDEHFVVGLHPRHPQVVIASPCSGHGYKFASVMGEVLADLATNGTTRHPIALFAPDRFLQQA